jgi:hypothetical protein
MCSPTCCVHKESMCSSANTKGLMLLDGLAAESSYCAVVDAQEVSEGS